MNLKRILCGLESSAATGAEAMAMARLGFLEWAIAGGDPTPQAARRALDAPCMRSAHSDAARAFVDYLRQAAMPLPSPVRRGRRRLLH